MPLLSGSWEKQWAPTSSWNGYDWELIAVDWPDRAEPVTERWRLIGETPEIQIIVTSQAMATTSRPESPLEAKKVKKVKKVKAMKGTKKTKAKKGTKKKVKKVKEAMKGTKETKAMKGTKKTKTMKEMKALKAMKTEG